MGLFDTHAHFCRADGDYKIERQIERAREAGVDRIIAVGGSDELNESALVAAQLFPTMISITLGLDRDHAEELKNQEAVEKAVAGIKSKIESLRTMLDKNGSGISTCGVGEIGLDYHYSAETATAQMALFKSQLQLANELLLPVVIHSRLADQDTLTLLREHAEKWRGDSDRIGVLHCFTGGTDFASELLDLGFHISFSGIVTFRNADPLREVAAEIPDKRILIETDSPYLAPAPMRGKRNEPAFVQYVASQLASLRRISTKTFIEQTSNNAAYLFGT